MAPQAVPLSPRLQDALGKFAHGAMASAVMQHRICLAAQGARGIRRCKQQMNVAAHRKIIEIIPQESRARLRDSELLL